MKPVELNNWFYGNSLRDQQEPIDGLRFLAGEVTGHPDYEDRTVVLVTSPFVEFDRERRLIRTKGGLIYHLGTVSESWNARYPDAERRFLDLMEAIHPSLTRTPEELA